MSKELTREEGGDKEEDVSDNEDDEFSFENTSFVTEEDTSIDGHIKPVFPLFNQELFFTAVELAALRESLSIDPPVRNVFVETKDSCAENDEIIGRSSRTAVEVSSPAVCKKSNSTGFSKLWRFKDFLGRSNSDGRDTFVFLNNVQAPTTSIEKSKVESSAKGKTVKTSSSAHEVYLKSRAKDDKRRSYLPYRPELMGFFTNVNGGLSRNTHPF